MKKGISILLLLSCSFVRADILPPPAASQGEVNAGTVKNKYVSPSTLAGWTGGGGGGGAGGIATNGGTGINNTFSNLTVKSTTGVTGPAMTFAGNAAGLGTNENIGEVWASDFGFSYTNTAAGNSNALNSAILVCSNQGGGIIRYGSRSTNSSAGQVISLSGEHLFPVLVYPSRIKFQGDGSTIISYSGTTTTNGVLFGQFDAENVFLSGPRTTNITDVYPYTNLVGIFEIGFWDPNLKNCYVTGFGQGFAALQTGSFRGAQFNGCHAVGCDIGFALGDACDQALLIESDGRSCLWGFDMGCITPLVTNSTFIPGMTGSSGSTNVGPSRFVKVQGGIWDYNYYASWVLGKGYLQLGTYAGNEHNYQLILGHPTNIITTVPYQNEGGPSITLDGCWWQENPVTTNIWVTPQGASSVVTIRQSPLGGTGWNVIGPLQSLHYDELSMSSGGTNWWPGAPNATGYSVTAGKFDYMTGPSLYSELFDEPNGAYNNGTLIRRSDFHISTTELTEPWSIGVVDASMVDRARVGFVTGGGNTYWWSGSGANSVNFGTGGTNAAGYGAVTNNLSVAKTNFVGHLVSTNDINANTNLAAFPSPITFAQLTFPTNLTNLSGSRVFYSGLVMCNMQSSSAAGGSACFLAGGSDSGASMAGQLQGFVQTFGLVTNKGVFPVYGMIGPGGYLGLNGSTTGTGSFVVFTNFSFTPSL